MTDVDAAPAQKLTRKERAELTRQRILAVAVDKFSHKPYNDVSVAELAQEAEVAHGLLFHHFDSKRNLFLEALRAVAAELERRHIESSREELDAIPGVRVRGMFQRHLRFMSEMPELAASIISGGIGSDPEAREIFEEDRWKISRWWVEMVGLDIDHPALQLTIRAATGAVDATTVHWLQHGAFELEAVADTLMGILVGCLRSARRLDPTVDVDSAIALLEPGDGPFPGS